MIQSCCPAIKNAWNLSIIDIDLIISAIRIATYGDTMMISHVCNKCGTENDYELSLSKLIDHFSSSKFNARVVFDDLIIKLQPLTYKQSTIYNIKHYEFQQQIYQAEKVENKEEQQKIINQLWKEFADMQQDMYISTIESVELSECVVTERGHIAEWISNCDQKIISLLKQQYTENQKNWKLPSFPVSCSNCSEQSDVNINVDFSNFFA